MKDSADLRRSASASATEPPCAGVPRGARAVSRQSSWVGGQVETICLRMRYDIYLSNGGDDQLQPFDDLADLAVEDALGPLVDERLRLAAALAVERVGDLPELLCHVQEIEHQVFARSIARPRIRSRNRSGSRRVPVAVPRK